MGDIPTVIKFDTSEYSNSTTIRSEWILDFSNSLDKPKSLTIGIKDWNDRTGSSLTVLSVYDGINIVSDTTNLIGELDGKYSDQLLIELKDIDHILLQLSASCQKDDCSSAVAISTTLSGHDSNHQDTTKFLLIMFGAFGLFMLLVMMFRFMKSFRRKHYQTIGDVEL